MCTLLSLGNPPCLSKQTSFVPALSTTYRFQNASWGPFSLVICALSCFHNGVCMPGYVWLCENVSVTHVLKITMFLVPFTSGRVPVLQWQCVSSFPPPSPFILMFLRGGGEKMLLINHSLCVCVERGGALTEYCPSLLGVRRWVSVLRITISLLWDFSPNPPLVPKLLPHPHHPNSTPALHIRDHDKGQCNF